jgi:hypothetical protein
VVITFALLGRTTYFYVLNKGFLKPVGERQCAPIFDGFLLL